MKVPIQVIIEADDGQVRDVQEVFRFERGKLKPETLGLSLAEGKKTLEGVNGGERGCHFGGNSGDRSAKTRWRNGPHGAATAQPENRAADFGIEC